MAMQPEACLAHRGTSELVSALVTRELQSATASALQQDMISKAVGRKADGTNSSALVSYTVERNARHDYVRGLIPSVVA